MFVIQSFFCMFFIQPYYFIAINHCFYVASFMCFSVYVNYIYTLSDIVLKGFCIASFISLHSFSALSLKQIKTLEIKTSMVFNLVFPINTILSCFFFFFLNNWLTLLIAVVNAQIYNPTVELIMPIGMPTNEAKAEIETHPLA